MEALISREKSIYRITWTGFFVNLLLSTGKLIAGLVGQSGAMVADGIHSISDFVTDLIVIFFVKISAKPKDSGHDYGHGKYETLATVVVGLALFAVGIGIFINGVSLIKTVMSGGEIAQPGIIALVAAFVSIVVKEGLYWMTIRVGKKANSPAVIANAWHHRSDAFSSVGTLLGIGGAIFLGDKWRVLDPIAAIAVSFMIAKVAYDLVLPGLNELLERSLPEEQENEILSLIMEDPQLKDPHNLKTRRLGTNIAIEVHVRMPGHMTVDQSHQATIDIEKRLRKKYGEGTLVVVHIEPIK